MNNNIDISLTLGTRADMSGINPVSYTHLTLPTNSLV